jgi:eukaryotic-like serine/threonine-protein kinase
MADATVTPTAVPLLFGRYRVQEQLGTTRLSSVYAASDERLQRQVLIHLLRKDLASQERMRDRFISEIAQSAQRSHQALLEVFDSGEAAGRPFMITECVRGRPLRGMGVLSVEQVLLLMRQVAGAIAVCQSHVAADMSGGLYHPPLSSSNLLMVSEGRVKLVENWQMPLDEVLADLAAYRAPELSEGQPLTLACDTYSLGLLLYELLTGERPVSGGDAQSIALAHLNVRIPPLAQCRPSLYLPKAEQVVAKATARYPEHRYANAQEFAVALDALWRDFAASTQPLAPPSVRHTPQPVSPPPPVVAIPRPRNSGGTDHISRPVLPSVSVNTVHMRNITRSLVGWLVMIGLLCVVATGSYMGVSALINQFSGISMPNLPSLPGLPSITTHGNPLSWLGGFFKHDTIYIVNLAEGLNLRAQPDMYNDANIMIVVPNSTPVTKLQDPVVRDNIPWLRVSVEVGGKHYEGWMSLKYLRQEQ